MQKRQNMSQWYERMSEIRENINSTQQEIAELMGIDYTAYNRYENGNTQSISRSLRKKLSKAYSEKDFHYIETGVTVEDVVQEEVREPLPEYGKCYLDQVVVPFHREVYASAGGGSENHSKAITSPVTFSKDFLNTFLGIYNFKGLSIINAAGDSMSPTIRSGELMFVYPMENEEFKDGGVYVLMCSNVLLVKRVTFDPLSKKYTLVSDNGRVNPVTLSIDEANDCRFVGRVVGHLDKV